jgi:hypothetical protein
MDIFEPSDLPVPDYILRAFRIEREKQRRERGKRREREKKRGKW